MRRDKWPAASLLTALLAVFMLSAGACTERGGGIADVTGEDTAVVKCNDDSDCAQDNECVKGTCVSGVCEFTPAAGACDDGNPCTVNDTCKEGLCVGEQVVCDDGLFCNGLETCDEETGECVPGNPPELDDGVECTVDSCDDQTGKVRHIEDHDACNDDDPCTHDVCDPLDGCVNTPFDGPCDDNDPCTVEDICANGVCAGVPKTCDDGLFCNGQETCEEGTGKCIAGAGLDMDDGFDCTLDLCDEENDVVLHLPDDTVCDDGNPCTLDLCDVEEGCVQEPAVGSCDDGDDCTVGDTCKDGVCTPGEWICIEICEGGEDEDFDDLVDCDDPDCMWEIVCLPDGETCESAWPLNKGEALHLDSVVDWNGSTLGKANDHSGSCSPPTAASPDVVHALSLGEPLGLDLTVDFAGEAWPAIYILDADCATERFCAAASSTAPFHTVVVLPAGDYFLCVDGAFEGDSGDYTLHIEPFEPAVSESGCANGLDDDADGLVDCDDEDCFEAPGCQKAQGETCMDAIELFEGPIADTGEPVQAVYSGTTAGMNNDLSGSCDPDTLTAPDAVFTFSTLDPMWLEASHDFKGVVLYPALYLLKEGCDEGSEVACAKGSEGAAIISMPLPAGTWFLVVDASYGKDAGPFDLNVTLSPLPEEEPDCSNGIDDDLDGATDCDDEGCKKDVACAGLPGDNCAQAFPLNDGLPVTADFAGQEIVVSGTTQGLHDFYAAACDPDTAGCPDAVYLLDLEAPMIVTASLDFEGDAYPALYVLDAECKPGTEVACAAAFSGAATLEIGLTIGQWYFVADGAYISPKGVGDQGPFVLKLAFTSPPPSETDCTDGLDLDLDGLTDCLDPDCGEVLLCKDKYESNDTLGTAAEIGEVSAEGFIAQDGTMIYPPGDVDWFRFSVAQPTFLEVVVTPDPSLDALVALTDAAGIILVSSETGGVGEPEKALLGVSKPGTYYVKISGFEDSSGPYGLTISLIPPSPSETACNDGSDEDLDELIDCLDPDCDPSSFCGAGDTCDAPLFINGSTPVDASMDGLQLLYEGTTNGYAADYQGSCSEPSQTAADAVWKLVLLSEMKVTIVLDFAGFGWPSLYVRKDTCDGQEILCGKGKTDPLQLEAVLAPGEYFIFIDGNFDKEAADYTLAVMFSLL